MRLYPTFSEIQKIEMDSYTLGRFRALWHQRKGYWMWLFSFCLLMTLLLGCANSQSQKASKRGKESIVAVDSFILPEIPTVLTNPEQRAEYLVAHYWDHFNFEDTTLISKVNVTEQAFVNYISLFPETSIHVVEPCIAVMLGKALSGGTDMFNHFVELYDKYLYDPNSPFRNEEYYIPVLRAIISNNNLDEIFKVRSRNQLTMVLKNRSGDIASDFTFTSSNGTKDKLLNIRNEYIILFFNSPDCTLCREVKATLSRYKNSKVKVVAIYVDEQVELWETTQYPNNWINGYAPTLRKEPLYDLKAIPTLYLLDKTKRVILKDAPVEQIIQYLNDVD